MDLGSYVNLDNLDGKERFPPLSTQERGQSGVATTPFLANVSLPGRHSTWGPVSTTHQPDIWSPTAQTYARTWPLHQLSQPSPTLGYGDFQGGMHAQLTASTSDIDFSTQSTPGIESSFPTSPYTSRHPSSSILSHSSSLEHGTLSTEEQEDAQWQMYITASLSNPPGGLEFEGRLDQQTEFVYLEPQQDMTANHAPSSRIQPALHSQQGLSLSLAQVSAAEPGSQDAFEQMSSFGNLPSPDTLNSLSDVPRNSVSESTSVPPSRNFPGRHHHISTPTTQAVSSSGDIPFSTPLRSTDLYSTLIELTPPRFEFTSGQFSPADAPSLSHHSSRLGAVGRNGSPISSPLGPGSPHARRLYSNKGTFPYNNTTAGNPGTTRRRESNRRGLSGWSSFPPYTSSDHPTPLSATQQHSRSQHAKSSPPVGLSLSADRKRHRASSASGEDAPFQPALASSPFSCYAGFLGSNAEGVTSPPDLAASNVLSDLRPSDRKKKARRLTFHKEYSSAEDEDEDDDDEYNEDEDEGDSDDYRPSRSSSPVVFRGYSKGASIHHARAYPLSPSPLMIRSQSSSSSSARFAHTPSGSRAKHLSKRSKGKARGSAALALAVATHMTVGNQSLPVADYDFDPSTIDLESHPGIRKRKNQPIPLPVPVPNLNKKSRGRKVPYVVKLDPETGLPDVKEGLIQEGNDPTVGESASGTSSRSSNRRKSSTPAPLPLDGERTYVCVVPGCGKCFVRGEHLKRHVRSIHTHDKPHVCPFEGCEKSFSRRDNLGQHVRIHLQP